MNTRMTHAFLVRRKAAVCILCFAIALAAGFPTVVFAEETQEEQKTVRVGYVNVATYEEGGEGEYKRGSGYEYLQKISYLTGWKYEYVYGSFKDCYEMLVNGEIDLFGNVSYTPERAELFDFATYPQGKDTYLLYTTNERAELTAGDLSQLNHCKIGVTEGSYQEGLLEEWLMSNEIQAETVKFDGYETLMAALDAGEIDAMATPDLSTSYEYLPIINIGFSDYYFAVSKERPDLLVELNEALYEIQNTEVDYNNLLVSRYHSQMLNNRLLNEKEKEWLDTHGKIIRFGYLKDNLPYSDRGDGGALAGIMETVVTTLENEYDIVVETRCYTTRTQMEKALNKGEIDVAGPVYSDFWLAEQHDFVLTDSVISTTPVILYSGDGIEGSMDVIAVSDTGIFEDEVVNILFPEAELYYCNSVEECLNAVAEGKAGCTIVTSSRLNVLRSNRVMEKLQVAEMAQNTEICMVTTKANRVVAAIVGKGIALSSEALNDAVLSQYSFVERDVTFKDFIEDHMVGSLCMAGLVILVLALMIYRLSVDGKRLSAALEEAQSASIAKTTFLSNMSHDIRTPMNAIIGFTNIALKRQPEEGIKNCLDKIEESSEHLLALINDVLDISRIESGKVKFAPVPIDLRAIMDVVLDITQGFLSDRDLTLHVDQMKLDHPYVMADPIRIREVLVNILSNAVKFTGDGGSITLTAEYQQRENDHKIMTRYTVSDTGVGMSQEYIGKIFEEFSQEKSDARTKYKGTGLGMPITKRYVEMMGGTIKVESQKGVGTTVVVELPMEMTSPEKVREQETPVAKRNLTGVRVLLVEDNEFNAEIAKMQLEDCGMEVTRVSDGKEALDSFSNHAPDTFDVILMDIMMPVMNGYEATKAIRSLKDRDDARTIPIIAMTANAFAEDVQASMDAGMNAHIAKPLIMEEVIRIIAGNI